MAKRVEKIEISECEVRPVLIVFGKACNLKDQHLGDDDDDDDDDSRVIADQGSRHRICVLVTLSLGGGPNTMFQISSKSDPF